MDAVLTDTEARLRHARTRAEIGDLDAIACRSRVRIPGVDADGLGS